ncbi:acetate--CoA ligase family protein [Bradyrhizobium sp. 195]|uniref:acetate--CoA ligase family protein n=1 Tax=Bradyrhizobium sp. 195 TaxID=2782662 RepID=UPI002000C9BA|nr:acetate--CoA ligase family protein [Bradyrhizobium sp. 195]UPK29920.1 acetate--CoA ligase family protein [Bradyrhizobium sp. 195]
MTETDLVRGLYRRERLSRLLEPKTVAVFGASQNAAALGSSAFENLRGFAGRVYPINPKYELIGNDRCYPSLRALPEKIDCAVIAVPYEGVEAVVKECADNQVGGAIIFSSGFAETGRSDRVSSQRRIAEIAREADLRLVGPNCIGVINFMTGFAAMFNRGVKILPARGPAIGIVSQSGAMGGSLATANQQGVSISHMLAGGNSCDVDVADFIAFLAEDPDCKSIACVFEGHSAPRRLLAAAEVAQAADKPLIVLKLARSEGGARAAMSHTGSLAGSEAAYRALLRKTGAIVVDTWEALLETAAFFAKAPRPSCEGVAVAGTSGGICIMAADSAEANGLILPSLDEDLRAQLKASIPDFGTADNPCDMTGVGRAKPEVITNVLRAFLTHDSYGTAIIPHPMPAEYAISRIPAFEALAAETGKPLCVVWTPGWLTGPGAAEFEQAPHLPLFRSMERCCATLKAWHEREAVRRIASAERQSVSKDARLRAHEFLSATKRAILTEDESKQLLGLYGISTVEERLAKTPEEAVLAALDLGFPVVLKIVSPDLPHKTEIGGVHLNLKNESEVREAFAAILAKIQAISPRPRIDGVLVQQMLKDGVEILLGAKVDPLFGPLVIIGIGGVFVELLRDTVTALAPVTKPEAILLLRMLKGRRLLEGFRGSKPVDIEALATVIALFSEFVADQADRIAEIDINPLICRGDQIVAVDALVALRAPG